jgi:hypothetical protein
VALGGTHQHHAAAGQRVAMNVHLTVPRREGMVCVDHSGVVDREDRIAAPEVSRGEDSHPVDGG